MYNFKGRLDQKNRLTIPAEIRQEFEGKLMITPGLSDDLHLYTEKTWKELEVALKVNPKPDDQTPTILNSDLIEKADHFYSNVQETGLDASRGRITLDADLVKLAGLDGERNWKAVRALGETGYYWRIRKDLRRPKPKFH